MDQMHGREGGMRIQSLILALWLLLGACGSDTATGVDTELERFVGDWQADSLVVRSVANPVIAPDLIRLGATFTLNVQPSGLYTAILLYAGQSQTEIGRIQARDGTVTLNRDFPSRATSTSAYVFTGSRLSLEGSTDFDFNLDGTPEPAIARFVLTRR